MRKLPDCLTNLVNFHFVLQKISVSDAKLQISSVFAYFTQLKQREYAIKLIYMRTKTQTKFVGTQCKTFQKRNIRIPSVYATIAVSNC